MGGMAWTGDRVGELLDDMDLALRDLTESLDHGPPARPGGSVGRWTAVQHVEHVARMLGLTADRLEANAKRLRDGALGKRPWRDPIQALFVMLVTREPFPRGGRAPKDSRPAAAPDRALTLQRLADGGARHRTLAMRLTPEERERLWFWNPFVPLPWHYTLAEILRVHATHARHHARLARQRLAASSRCR